ncbi:MAG: hypothetical protein Pars2KO_16860 [Parasphingorhabdus sp.]
MNLEQKKARLEKSLERAAEMLGDITQPTMRHYYKQFPEAKSSFEEHGNGRSTSLEAEMVDSVLYCLMYWLERRFEIEIIFGSSVSHHEDTLRINHEWYVGLVQSAAAVIKETIPETEAEELEVWQEISDGLVTAMAAARE